MNVLRTNERRGMSLLVGLLIAGPVVNLQAALIHPTSYDMPNGSTGSYQYWDESYSGAGDTTVNLAPLSGGLGDLTDGAIAGDNWFVVEAPAGPGPYVGWTIDPTIHFHFAGTVRIDKVTLYADDSNGSGGVSAPVSVELSMGGTSLSFPLVDPPSSAPLSYDLLTPSFVGDELVMTVSRRNVWVFLSEVVFEGASAGIPDGSNAVTLAAMGFLVAALWKRRMIHSARSDG